VPWWLWRAIALRRRAAASIGGWAGCRRQRPQRPRSSLLPFLPQLYGEAAPEEEPAPVKPEPVVVATVAAALPLPPPPPQEPKAGSPPPPPPDDDDDDEFDVVLDEPAAPGGDDKAGGEGSDDDDFAVTLDEDAVAAAVPAPPPSAPAPADAAAAAPPPPPPVARPPPPPTAPARPKATLPRHEVNLDLPPVLPSQARPGQRVRLPGQSRVTQEEYREFLSLGHGEIFNLPIDL